MNQVNFIRDFTSLGAMLRSYLAGERMVLVLDSAITKSVAANPWFTDYHVREMLGAIADNYLRREELEKWLSSYPEVWYGFKKDITIVMAGNIPLVGYHDYLSVLASGRRASVKLSSKDVFLLPALHGLLCSLSPAWRSRVRFVTDVPADTDGLIATGSDSTAAWFTKHYPQIPKIVRGHRASIALIPEGITQEQIAGLHRDMFLYFGLGCRSVVRLFVPEGFDLLRLTTPVPYRLEAQHTGFRNAYRQQKALLTLQKRPFIDGGFFILQPEEGLIPPVATIFYSFYSHINEVLNYLNDTHSRLQCVVGIDAEIKKCVNFGSAQNPQLWDYADQIDTIKL